jgi:hypothetical protein
MNHPKSSIESMEENNVQTIMKLGTKPFVLTIARERPYATNPKTKAIPKWYG